MTATDWTFLSCALSFVAGVIAGCIIWEVRRLRIAEAINELSGHASTDRVLASALIKLWDTSPIPKTAFSEVYEELQEPLELAHQVLAPEGPAARS